MKTFSQYTLEQAELAQIAIEEAYKVGAKVTAGGKPGVIQSRGGEYYDVHHEDGNMKSYHVSEVKGHGEVHAKKIADAAARKEAKSSARRSRKNFSNNTW